MNVSIQHVARTSKPPSIGIIEYPAPGYAASISVTFAGGTAGIGLSIQEARDLADALNAAAGEAEGRS